MCIFIWSSLSHMVIMPTSLLGRGVTCALQHRFVEHGLKSYHGGEPYCVTSMVRGGHSFIKLRATVQQSTSNTPSLSHYRADMDILRSIAHQPTMCEHSVNKPSEIKRKKSEEQIQATQELSRIITDPTKGKCYCRGKVLGKVNSFQQIG